MNSQGFDKPKNSYMTISIQHFKSYYYIIHYYAMFMELIKLNTSTVIIIIRNIYLE